MNSRIQYVVPLYRIAHVAESLVQYIPGLQDNAVTDKDAQAEPGQGSPRVRLFFDK
jgi:hypothetical protein